METCGTDAKLPTLARPTPARAPHACAACPPLYPTDGRGGATKLPSSQSAPALDRASDLGRFAPGVAEMKRSALPTRRKGREISAQRPRAGAGRKLAYIVL